MTPRPVRGGCTAQLVLATGTGDVVCLQIGPASLSEIGRVTLGTDVACLDLVALGHEQGASYVVVGGWDMSLRLLAVPSLAEAVRQAIRATHPRDVKLVSMEGVDYLLCAGRRQPLHIHRAGRRLSVGTARAPSC